VLYVTGTRPGHMLHYAVCEWTRSSAFHLHAPTTLASCSPLPCPQDASFRAVPGLAGGGVSFESYNFPGHFRESLRRLRLWDHDTAQACGLTAAVSARFVAPVHLALNGRRTILRPL